MADNVELVAALMNTKSTDAYEWAVALAHHAEQYPTIAQDAGAMLGWFANAIMNGIDAGRAKALDDNVDIIARARQAQQLAEITRDLAQKHANENLERARRAEHAALGTWMP